MTNGKHVRVAEGGGTLICDNCGDKYKVNLPCLLAVAAATFAAYAKAHANCEPKPQTIPK